MKKLCCLTILIVVISPCAIGLQAVDETQAMLHARAKISEAKAREIASAKVPSGTIKSAELEEENGKLIYSFDISTPGTSNITEVAVDAITSNVVNVSVETPKDQIKESEADKLEGKKAKAVKEKDEDDEKDEKDGKKK
jgi:hypothetical protein